MDPQWRIVGEFEPKGESYCGNRCRHHDEEGGTVSRISERETKITHVTTWRDSQKAAKEMTFAAARAGTSERGL